MYAGASLFIENKGGEQLIAYGMNGSGKTKLIKKVCRKIHNADVRSSTTLCSRCETVWHFVCRQHSASTILYRKWITYMYQIGIDELLDKNIYTLSSGQIKRIQLLDVVINNNKLWLIDEPENFLDKNAVHFLHNKVMEHLNSNGILLCTMNKWVALKTSHCIGLNGFEPLTSRLSSEHSKPLSYRPGLSAFYYITSASKKKHVIH